LTMKGTSFDINQKADVCLTAKEIESFAAAYASGYQEDCLVSPLFGDLTDLPPSYIYVGSDEILLDDSVMMAERLKQFGVFCRLNIAEGMWHA
ncbi:MAG: alpha/beta hydrolase fold domain-containing protein, partial [Clostridiales bacterium]